MSDDSQSGEEQHPRWISETLIQAAAESSEKATGKPLDRDAAIALLQQLSQLLNSMGTLNLESNDGETQ